MNFIIVILAKYLLYIIILLALFFFLKTGKKLNFIKLSIIGLPLSYIIAKILNKFIYDPRPFVVEHTKPLIEHAADNGFPSDHTLLAATVAFVIFVINKKIGLKLIVLAFILGYSRILAKVHSPIDILGSFVIAAFAVFLAQYLGKKLKLL